jgi:hypothetical protein
MLLTRVLWLSLMMGIFVPCVMAEDVSGPPPLGVGDLTQLVVQPTEVEIVGPDAAAQLVVTGRFTNQGVRDVTREVSYSSLDSKVVEVSSSGYLVPLGEGTTKVVAECGGQVVELSVAVSGFARPQPINFTNEIVPILTKLGCNNGGCHGKADGQNGFKLSLLGFDPVADYRALVQEARGRRIELAAAEQSLLLVKPTGQLGHGGGKPLKIDSPEHQLLARWIETGALFGSANDPHVIGISISPGHSILARQAGQQIRVKAHYSDGSSSDVTRRAEFKSNDGEIVEVTTKGLIQTGDHFGEGSVMVRYLGHVDVFRATIPRLHQPDAQARNDVASKNFVDSLVFAKLEQLGLPPSQLCTDGEFLRRASIDITGTLPAVDEAKQFLADRDPRKREKLIDNLLERSEYVSYFTMKWADILRVRGGVRDPKDKVEAARKAAEKKKITPLDKDAHRADVFRNWIYESIKNNKPYDKFVREIIVTNGDTSGPKAPPASLWYLQLKTPQGLIEDTAQAFLGTRIQCAQCHHHPFEKWSQDDYWGLAGFFSRVQWQTSLDKNGKRVKEMKPVRLSEAGRMGQFIGFTPDGKLTNPNGKEFVHPKPLDSEELSITAKDDPREKLVDWMTAPDNPFFARAVVNRYWGHFFRHAIVEPLDDLRVTNPPSNPQLLDALARDFVDHKFDLKHLIRTICTSATYQLSSLPNNVNGDDKRNYARYLPVRMPAEVLLDAVDQVTESPTQFTAMGGYKFPAGTRAIDLPDAYVSSYFLRTFGRPERKSACACEREPSVTLAQRAHMLNGSGVIRQMSAQAAKLMTGQRPLKEQLTDLYLTCFTRYPTDEELTTVSDYIAAKSDSDKNKQQAYYDVVWALLNAKEFSFRH